MRVIVTRPQPQANEWVSELRREGLDALALPLIATQARTEASALKAAWVQAQSALAVMFVSAAAVDAIAKAVGSVGISAYKSSGQLAPRLWCTGPGTRARLLDVGFPAEAIDAPDAQARQFDSEALWERVHQQVHAGDRLLIVRGDDRDLSPEQTGDDPGRGRDWLAGRVRDAGAQVNFLVAYERSLPIWSAEQQSLAKSAAMDRSVWLFSSSRALEHLKQIMPEQSWSHTRCLCTHPRIAELARRLGFSKVGVTLPDLYAVMASIKSES